MKWMLINVKTYINTIFSPIQSHRSMLKMYFSIAPHGTADAECRSFVFMCDPHGFNIEAT